MHVPLQKFMFFKKTAGCSGISGEGRERGERRETEIVERGGRELEEKVHVTTKTCDKNDNVHTRVY